MTLVLTVGACSGGDDTAVKDQEADRATTETTTSTSTSTTTVPEPDPVAEVVFVYSSGDVDFPLVRFVARISNPGAETLTGVRTTWKSLDADGVIVGTFENRPQPAIPAGDSIYYVGGAGGANLSGVPTSVTVEIAATGSFVDMATEPAASVEGEPTFTRAGFDLNSNARDYDVTYTILANEDLVVDDLSLPVILLDTNGEIIGAEFGDVMNVPAALAAGEKARITATVSVPEGVPVTVQAFAMS